MSKRETIGKPLLILGSGRSGTTWILDEIANENSMQSVFEPLQESVSQVAKQYGNTYVPAQCEDAILYEFVKKILDGHCNTIWSKYRIVPHRLIPSIGYFSSYNSVKELYRRYRSLFRNVRTYHSRKTFGQIAVKFIRANLMLDWLTDNFDCNILFVMRHPGAVVESKIRLDAVSKASKSLHGNSDWDPYAILEMHYNDARLKEDLLDKYMPNLKIQQISPVEAQTIVWCIENTGILHSELKSNVHLTCYEWLVDEETGEWQRLCKKLAIQPPKTSHALGTPSQQASPDFRATAGLEQKLSRWQSRLSGDDKLAMQSVLDRFDIGIYRMDSPWPIKSLHL